MIANLSEMYRSDMEQLVKWCYDSGVTGVFKFEQSGGPVSTSFIKEIAELSPEVFRARWFRWHRIYLYIYDQDAVVLLKLAFDLDFKDNPRNE